MAKKKENPITREDVLKLIEQHGGPDVFMRHSAIQGGGFKTLADHIFAVLDVPEPFQPIVNVVPLQFLAYHVAVMRGRAVGKPRNLAKSVTME